MTDRHELDWVAFREGDGFGIVCLQHSLTAQGKTLAAARKGLMTVYRAYVDHADSMGRDHPFEDLGPADPHFHDLHKSVGNDMKGTIYNKDSEILEEPLDLAA